MTLRDLIDELTDLADELGEDTEVRIAFQPSWPFEYSVGEVVAVDPADDGEDDEEEHDAGPARVYIGEGQQLGYLPGDATRALGWGRR